MPAKTTPARPPKRFTASSRITYREAGVDIEAKMKAVSRFGRLARETFSKSVLTEIGSFGGLYNLGSHRVRRPVLVSSIDGVGTKLRIAFKTGIHHTVGQDLVNHCVNDILVQGAIPLFFLDYLATGKVEGAVLREVVRGMALGCRQNGCALIGGETAEMPGFYREGEYDLAGCIVGLVERNKILDGRRIRPGDRLIGLPSSGLHTNGFSLARKVLLEISRLSLSARPPELGGLTLGEELLRPHRSYLPLIRPLLAGRDIKAMAHITGGGITDNLPRVLPEGCGARVDPNRWSPLPIFGMIQKRGRVRDAEMRRTFNLGIGLILVASPAGAKRIALRLGRRGEACLSIGEVTRGPRRVVYGRTR